MAALTVFWKMTGHWFVNATPIWAYLFTTSWAKFFP
jgi:hypothetical protein